MATQSNSKKNKKENAMKNDTISRLLATIPALELEYRHLCFSQGDGIGFEPSMLMLENENRSLIDELAGFANAIWA
jgi:hypothetical protein